MARMLKESRGGATGKNLRRQRNLVLGNYQLLRPINLRLLRQVVHALLMEIWPELPLDLTISIVAASEITRVNETFLRHQGSTDVITFDYSDRAGEASRLAPPPALAAPSSDRRDACPTMLHGEIFVCMDEALVQARRFRTTWQSELVRYIVHGVLHLLGYDDLRSTARRNMKQAEDNLLRSLSRRFSLCSLDARTC
jgi:probable rRNA maturation factor